MSQVVTRFAPSPTGFLHIGGARTALFNWLYAKRFGGKFLLRIEDTDRERSTKAAVDAIIDGLNWLGLDWDGEAISQFKRADRHREVAHQLLASGAAYRCYASPEELEEMREKARLEGKPMRYDGRWRDRDPAEAPPGVKPVIRLRAAQEGETVIDDKVQGKVTFANKDLDDLVLLRSDGNPTYMLAVVVDDHDMGVTHIIRGDDHLTNAARQTQIYQAPRLGCPGDGASAAHSRAGRREALQAPRRARRRRLPRDGLSARGAYATISRGSAGATATRSSSPPRSSSPRSICRRRPFALALRLRQARERQRTLYARDERRGALRRADRHPALSARRPRDRGQAR